MTIKLEVWRLGGHPEHMGWKEVSDDEVKVGPITFVVTPGLGAVAAFAGQPIQVPKANGTIVFQIVKVPTGQHIIDAADHSIEKLRTIWEFEELHKIIAANGDFIFDGDWAEVTAADYITSARFTWTPSHNLFRVDFQNRDRANVVTWSNDATLFVHRKA